MLDNNINVIAYDLRGHGLSEGKRTYVSDFSLYSADLDSVIKLTDYSESDKKYIIGFSTGSSVVYEYLHNYEESFDKIVMTSPLIRSDMWYLSVFLNKITGNLITTLPRFHKKNSSDNTYVDFVKNKDYISDDYIYTGWFDALMEWNIKVVDYPVIDNSNILIIQGNADNVVNWKYNIEFLSKKIKNAEIIIVPEGRHQLFNEKIEIRNLVLEKILFFIYTKT